MIRTLENVKKRLLQSPSSNREGKAKSPNGSRQNITPRKKRASKPRNERLSPVLASADVDSYKVEDMFWDVSNADLYLRAQNSLFPVHRSRIGLLSPILRNIIVSIGYHDESATVISIGELGARQMQQLLEYMYFPDRKVNGELSILDGQGRWFITPRGI